MSNDILTILIVLCIAVIILQMYLIWALHSMVTSLYESLDWLLSPVKFKSVQSDPFDEINEFLDRGDPGKERRDE